MGMSLRSYERFEAGDGEIKLEKLFRFAVVTNSDPLGVVVEVYLGEAGLADQCADHKPLLINALALKRFCAASPDDLRLMDPVTLIDAFSRAYEDLGDVAKKRRAIADEWLSGTPPDADPKDDDDET
ncbi:hypothetical protein ASE17_20615 [Phenylobacterium sp. Root77]|nr:hypothetical protein ASC73_17990 [Phenylobacterium sp. Root1277]KQW89715.1 hypothetical protein ASC79_18895 [Phenylobacterium sp. Root1290]KRC43596.1 hypothetical protein ASE17_20615 [Phenylobacterium sp. Root77]